MATRRCTVCNGTGSLWGTPPLIEEGGLLNDKQLSLNSEPRRDYGTDVKCWRCVGRGWMPDDEQDIGQHNG